MWKNLNAEGVSAPFPRTLVYKPVTHPNDALTPRTMITGVAPEDLRCNRWRDTAEADRLSGSLQKGGGRVPYCAIEQRPLGQVRRYHVTSAISSLQPISLSLR
jgi:hypothetical protein